MHLSLSISEEISHFWLQYLSILWGCEDPCLKIINCDLNDFGLWDRKKHTKTTLHDSFQENLGCQDFDIRLKVSKAHNFLGATHPFLCVLANLCLFFANTCITSL